MVNKIVLRVLMMIRKSQAWTEFFLQIDFFLNCFKVESNTEKITDFTHS